MAKLLVKNIYTGSLNARDEIKNNDNTAFVKCFVMPPNFSVDDILNTEKYFITGLKGTGKTALLHYLANEIKKRDHNALISFIYFKEFDNADKTKLQTVAERINYNNAENNDIEVKKDLLSIDGYIYIWKWLLLEHIIKDSSKPNFPFKKDSYLEKFKNSLLQIRFDRLNKKKFMFPSSIKIAAKLEQSSITPEATLFFDKQKYDHKAFERFKIVIDETMEYFEYLTYNGGSYYVLIDELEAFYAEKDVFIRDLHMLRDLIITIKEFDILFREQNFQNVKFICSVRTEILNSIYKQIPSYEINKIVNSYESPVKWNHNFNDSLQHPILQILLRRIRYSEELNDSSFNLTNEALYEKWFVPKINDTDTKEKLLNETWNKPRDIVRFLLSVNHSLSSNCSKFNAEVFTNSFEEYSRESLIEITEELNAIYTKSQISDIINCFTGFKTKFSHKELKERIDNHFPDSIFTTYLTQVLNDLYRIGFIGTYSEQSKQYLWYHRGNSNLAMGEEWQYIIHRGLYKTLAIDTQTTYKKALYAIRRELRVGEDFETTVESILEKSLRVTFSDNFSIFNGIIPIDECEERFIEKLQDLYYEGQKINAKLIKINNSVYVFSKKKYEEEAKLKSLGL